MAFDLKITGGTIVDGTGKPGFVGDVGIKDGKVVMLGKADGPATTTIDATGKVVVPGLVEAHSSRGMDQQNESNPNVPFLSVLDALDPSAEWFDECRRNGVTTALVIPGNNTMLGGQGAVVKTAGGYVDEMIAKRSAGIKISLRPTAMALARFMESETNRGDAETRRLERTSQLHPNSASPRLRG